MNFHNVTFETSFGLSAQLPPSEQVEIVFAGRSNVGKSSAINKILNRKSLARVSGVPGKTATINFFRVDGVRFVDLPGYGYAKVSKSEQRRWSELIEGYFAQERDIGVIALLVDARHPATALDVQMANFLIDRELPFLIVLTKMDKLNKTGRAARLAAIQTELPCGEQLTFLPFSSETGEGVEKFREIVEDLAGEE